jgi:hypothetical protein
LTIALSRVNHKSSASCSALAQHLAGKARKRRIRSAHASDSIDQIDQQRLKIDNRRAAVDAVFRAVDADLPGVARGAIEPQLHLPAIARGGETHRQAIAVVGIGQIAVPRQLIAQERLSVGRGQCPRPRQRDQLRPLILGVIGAALCGGPLPGGGALIEQFGCAGNRSGQRRRAVTAGQRQP